MALCLMLCKEREKRQPGAKGVVWPLWTFASCKLTAPAAHESRLLYQTPVGRRHFGRAAPYPGAAEVRPGASSAVLPPPAVPRTWYTIQ